MGDNLVLGVDLGGTKIAAGVVAATGRLLCKVRVPTPCKGVTSDLAGLFDAASAALGSAKVTWADIRALGVGVPGAIDPRTETVWAPNLPGWKKVPLRKLLEKVLRIPVYVEADRNAQALAEAWLGQGANRSIRNLACVTVGTGIGAGLICEGRLIRGARGLAGAAGWLAVTDRYQLVFARTGCLEALAAGPAVARRAQHAAKGEGCRPRNPLGWKSGLKLTAAIVAAAARRGDPRARRALEQVGNDLGRGVANIVSLLNPECVVLGGGLAAAGSLILLPLRRAVHRWAQPLAARQVRIVRSRLGDDAGILGAARYALLKLEEKS